MVNSCEIVVNNVSLLEKHVQIQLVRKASNQWVAELRDVHLNTLMKSVY